MVELSAMNEEVLAYKRSVEEYYRRFVAGGFGTTRLAFYGDEAADLPQEVRDASLACGNPVKHLLAADPARRSGRLLDLGCGGGMDLVIAGTKGGFDRAVGLDASAGMIDRCAQSIAAAPGAPLSCLRGDAESLPFRDGSFKAVISNAAVNLVPDKRAAFEEIRRVLTPDGALFLADVCVLAPIPVETRRKFSLLDGLYFAPTLLPWEEELRLLRGTFDTVRTLALIDILPDARHADDLVAAKKELSPRERKFARRGLMKGSFRVIEVEAVPVARGKLDPVQCRCGVTVEAESHQTIDLDTSPRLLARLRDGRLNRYRCFACGATGPLPAPVLVHAGESREPVRGTLFPREYKAIAGDLFGRLPPGEIVCFSVEELCERVPHARRRLHELSGTAAATDAYN